MLLFLLTGPFFNLYTLFFYAEKVFYCFLFFFLKLCWTTIKTRKLENQENNNYNIKRHPTRKRQLKIRMSSQQYRITTTKLENEKPEQWTTVIRLHDINSKKTTRKLVNMKRQRKKRKQTAQLLKLQQNWKTTIILLAVPIENERTNDMFIKLQ